MFKFNNDPLKEEKYTIFPGLVCKHQDRILVEMNFSCPIVCDFCTRKRKDINKNDFFLTTNDWLKIEDYINKHIDVREVIFSGGDPLVDIDLLMKIVKRIRKMKQIKIIRIHTRIPITAPEKITTKLVDFFKTETKKQVIYLSIHCDHKKELTRKSIEAIGKLRQSGVTLYSQSVFLKGYNDSFKDLKELFETLLELGIRPYYLYQCDKIDNWKKFKVPIWKEIYLIRKLNRNISGLACPIFTIDSSKGKKRFF